MTAAAWLRRRAWPRTWRSKPAAETEVADAWLDTLHCLATARTAERSALERSGVALRARLRPRG
jgi:hypothetical protein